MPVGAAIMLVHDASDLPVTIGKLVFDNTPTYVEVISFLVMITCWIFTRLYMFPFHLVLRLLEECYFGEKISGMNYDVLNMMVAFLCGLVCMHTYWTILMFKAVFRKSKNPKIITIKNSAIKVE
jgi:hypothetical protein